MFILIIKVRLDKRNETEPPIFVCVCGGGGGGCFRRQPFTFFISLGPLMKWVSLRQF